MKGLSQDRDMDPLFCDSLSFGAVSRSGAAGGHIGRDMAGR